MACDRHDGRALRAAESPSGLAQLQVYDRLPTGCRSDDIVATDALGAIYQCGGVLTSSPPGGAIGWTREVDAEVEVVLAGGSVWSAVEGDLTAIDRPSGKVARHSPVDDVRTIAPLATGVVAQSASSIAVVDFEGIVVQRYDEPDRVLVGATASGAIVRSVEGDLEWIGPGSSGATTLARREGVAPLASSRSEWIAFPEAGGTTALHPSTAEQVTLTGNPVLLIGSTVVVERDGGLDAFALGSGSTRWTRDLQVGSSLARRPALRQGQLWILPASGPLIQIDPASGEEIGYLSPAVLTPRADRSLLAVSGASVAIEDRSAGTRVELLAP